MPRPIRELLSDEGYAAVGAENGATNGTFHPTTEAPVGFRQVVTMLREAGHAIEDVTWGAFRAQLERQRDEIRDLRGEVHELAQTVHDLTTRLAIVADRHEREHP